MDNREVLISTHSPICDIEALVEQDDQTCYFYLWRHPNTDHSSMVSCFVSNVASKAKAISLEEWRNSNIEGPPTIPYEYVTHSTDGLAFTPDQLEIVWTTEGSGAGLLCEGELIAFIPEWSNEECPGYSNYISGTTPYGWEMTQAKDNLQKQLNDGKRFWQAVSEDYWREFQQSHLTKIEEFVGATNQYYAIDGGHFPPKALVTAEQGNVLYGITLGVSALRQPMVEGFYQEKTPDFSRIELGFACNKDKEQNFMPMLERMSGWAQMPWGNITSLGHGHTISCNAIEGFAAVWLLNANLLSPGASPAYAPAFGERINLLWAVPITQEEYDFLKSYNMEKIFPLTFAKGIHIFDGTPKVPMDLLNTL